MKHSCRALLAVAAIALTLGGCAKLQEEMAAVQQALSTAISTKVSQREAYLATEAFDIVEITATNYLRLRVCTSNSGPVCRDPAMTPRIQAAILSGRSSRNNLKGYLRAHVADGADAAIAPVQDFNLLQSATETIKALTAAYTAARGS